ncbi:MAG: class I SAM-dependent methyltransferase [Armatimonadota bacterium]
MRNRSNSRRLLSLTIGLLVVAAASAAAQRQERPSRDQWQQPAQVMAELHLRPGNVVADVGCGRGYFLFRFAEAVGDEGKVLGVDISERALDAARERAQEQDVTNVEFVLSEPTDTKLQPDSVDVACICMVLHHVPTDQQQPLLGSVAKSLKPGGYLYVIDVKQGVETPFRWHGEQLPREELTQKATAAGLTLNADFYCLRYQYFIRFMKPEPEE